MAAQSSVSPLVEAAHPNVRRYYELFERASYDDDFETFKTIVQQDRDSIFFPDLLQPFGSKEYETSFLFLAVAFEKLKILTELLLRKPSAANTPLGNRYILNYACQIQNQLAIDAIIQHVKPKNIFAATPYQDTALYYASVANDVETVKKLLIKSDDAAHGIMIKSKEKDYPIHIVTKNGNLEIARLFKLYNVDFNIKDASFYTPLHSACLDGQEKMVLYLLEQNVLVNELSFAGFSALTFAIWKNLKIAIPALLNAGAEINAVDKTMNNQLHNTVKQGREDMIEKMLTYISANDINAINKKGETMFMLACRNARFAGIILWLLTGYERKSVVIEGLVIQSIPSQIDPGMNAFHIAISNQPEAVLKRFIAVGPPDLINIPALTVKNANIYPIYPIFYALQTRKPEIIRIIAAQPNLNWGVKIENTLELARKTFNPGDTVLHVAMSFLEQSLIDFYKCVYEASWFKSFLGYANAQNQSGETPLHYVIFNIPRKIEEEGGYSLISKMIELLVSVGVNVNLGDAKGNTALHYAIEYFNFEGREFPYYQSVYGVVKRLLLKKSNYRRYNHVFKTPLTLLCSKSGNQSKLIENPEKRKKYIEENNILYAEDGKKIVRPGKQHLRERMLLYMLLSGNYGGDKVPSYLYFETERPLHILARFEENHIMIQYLLDFGENPLIPLKVSAPAAASSSSSNTDVYLTPLHIALKNRNFTSAAVLCVSGYIEEEWKVDKYEKALAVNPIYLKWYKDIVDKVGPLPTVSDYQDVDLPLKRFDIVAWILGFNGKPLSALTEHFREISKDGKNSDVLEESSPIWAAFEHGENAHTIVADNKKLCDKTVIAMREYYRTQVPKGWLDIIKRSDQTCVISTQL